MFEDNDGIVLVLAVFIADEWDLRDEVFDLCA